MYILRKLENRFARKAIDQSFKKVYKNTVNIIA